MNRPLNVAIVFGTRPDAVKMAPVVHHMAADSKGNLYTAEIVTNNRAQRFVLQKAAK